MTKVHSLTVGLAASLAVALAGPAAAEELDAVSFGTNWLAQAEHGGFYQAVADGTYEAHGLDVTIVQGGPNAANQALLMADRIQFYMQGNLIGSFSAAEQDIPVVAVAAIFQKDPQVLIAHPDSGVETFADLAKLPTIFMGKDLFSTGFQWMKAAFPGFRDEQIKPYTFNPAPFLADKMSAQQGYITSEPYAIEREGGFVPELFLMADAGFDTPSTMIEVKADYIAANRDVVQRFVDASIIGWYNYLYGDNTAANDLIKQDNPEMTDGQIAFSIEQMRDFGLIDSGAAETGGIGCLSMEQVRSFHEKMVEAGVVQADIDYAKVADDGFACKNVGAELKSE
ncbi:ABC transporter substrate-binding protein [Bauldia sp.]|uniref:ABC transporter substrate-binding protein n=1 Tax=Bauldia sp. TaxID=2575872 RepID=UPI003BAB9FD7